MADIERRRRKKKKPQDENIMACPIPQGGHDYLTVLTANVNTRPHLCHHAPTTKLEEDFTQTMMSTACEPTLMWYFEPERITSN